MRSATIVLLALVVAGCSKVNVGAVPSGPRANAWTIPGVVRLSETEEPNSLVRAFSNQASADDVTALLFEPLFRFDEHGNPVPGLATEFPTTQNGLISADGLRITFKLRPRVMWSDGAPVTADDVIFTWRTIMNPANAVVSTWGYENIVAMRKDGPLQVTMVLKRPFAAAVFLFSEGSFPPLPAHALGGLASLNKDPFNAHPIGDGPFVVRRWTHGQDLVLEANPRYWRGPPALHEVDIKFIPDANTVAAALRTHEIDVIDGVSKPLVPQLRGLAGVALSQNVLANYRHMEFNCRNPILSDANVRRAIAHAVDVDRIIHDVYGGYALRAVTDIPPFSWAANHLSPPAFDPALARKILDEDGWIAGPDGIRAKHGQRLELTISSATGNRPNQRAEEMVAEGLKPLGIDLSIKNYAPSVLFAQDGPLYSGRYDIEWTVSTNGTDPDDIGNWGCGSMPPHGANTAFYCDAAVDRYLVDAQTHYDHERRKRDYESAWAIMLRDVPGLMIYWDKEVVAVNSDLQNFKPSPYITDYWNAWEWKI